MRTTSDTIAALATAQAPAGIGIIRISGKAAAEIADRHFCNTRGERVLNALSAGVLRHGYFTDVAGERLDEIMAVVFRAPHSYTGEEMVELHCHGGLFVLKRVLDELFADGARPAEPGEFTKRAFLNGRVDLAQAEAVMGVIAAENEVALKSAERELCGALSERIRSMRERLLHESAFIEAALDDPESFAAALNGYGARLTDVVDGLCAHLAALLSHADDGILLREGVRTVIVGRPNAGKSSLLNFLAGRERAIVSPFPGTTRDTVEERVRVGEIVLHLIDTAGIATPLTKTSATERPPREDLSVDGRQLDAIERIGIERARQALAGAELVLFVYDASLSVDADTLALFAETKGKQRIVVANKVDLLSRDPISVAAPVFENATTIRFSAKTGYGFDELRAAIESALLSDDWRAEDIIITQSRHKKLLEEAQTSLASLRETIAQGLSEDFYTVELMDAYRALGEIIGEEVGDDLVDEIFSKFCMGK